MLLSSANPNDQTQHAEPEDEWSQTVRVMLRGASSGAVEAVHSAVLALPRDADVALEVVSASVGEVSDWLCSVWVCDRARFAAERSRRRGGGGV